LSDNFPVQNHLKQGDALLASFFIFALEYATRKVQENTHILIDTSKEVGVEVNIEKTQYMLLIFHQNAGQNRDIKMANRSWHNSSIWARQ
jgi:hypothetical protein